jgi:hypothetical protein
MKIQSFKTVFVGAGLASLLMVSTSYAKCYPGLDCPEDLPGSEQKNTTESETTAGEDWQMVDRYIVKRGLVKDPTTGLIWMRCSFGQTWYGADCHGEAAKVDWAEAMTVPEHFDYEGYSDWRMPTIEELKSLVYCSSGQPKRWFSDVAPKVEGCQGNFVRPTIFNAAFSQTPSTWFWTSSANAIETNFSWTVNFNSGYDGYGNKTGLGAVRLVREEH